MSWNQAACQGESQRLRFQLALSKAQSARAMNVVSPICATVSDLDVFDYDFRKHHKNHQRDALA